jgi:hypothetical protein
LTYLEPPYPSGASNQVKQAVALEVKREEIIFDEVIRGPVCNDSWSGTIYVTCDIQIPLWEKDPFFFQDCDLDIDEEAVIYVQAHRDKSYNKGCSCHE